MKLIRRTYDRLDAPTGAPQHASAVAPDMTPALPCVLAEHRMARSAVLELPKGSAFLQLPPGDPPPYAKRVLPFRAYAGVPNNRGNQSDVWRIWDDAEDAPLDAPSARYHAWAFLNCLQADLAGQLIPASDLKKLYPRFCHSMNLPQRTWQTVAAHLKRFTGGGRSYRRINGRNIRVYRIPERRKRVALGVTP